MTIYREQKRVDLRKVLPYTDEYGQTRTRQQHFDVITLTIKQTNLNTDSSTPFYVDADAIGLTNYNRAVLDDTYIINDGEKQYNITKVVPGRNGRLQVLYLKLIHNGQPD